jgi:hypothetical protein
LARGYCGAHWKKWNKYGDPLGSHLPMPDKGCSVDGCNNRHEAFGYCPTHYMRFKKHGSPTGGGTYAGETNEFLSKAATCKDAACLIWPFSKTRWYGQINFDGRPQIASRVVCEMVNGPPPEEWYHAAHDCGNGHIGCVNGSHLAWKTPAQNNEDKWMHGTAKGTRRKWQTLEQSTPLG